MATKKKPQSKKTAKQAKATVDKQRITTADEAGRDEKGRFAEGNQHGFQPGESGNPAGRPKHTRLTDALTAKLAKLMPEASEETIAEGLAQALIDAGLQGDVRAISLIADRVEGKPRLSLDVNANIHDWRALAQANGLSETDVLDEAKRLIESAALTGGAQPD